MIDNEELNRQSEELIALINYGRWDQVTDKVESMSPAVFLQQIATGEHSAYGIKTTNPLRAAKKQLESEIKKHSTEMADDFSVIKSVIYRMSERLRESGLLDNAPSLDRKIAASALRTPTPNSPVQGFIARASQHRHGSQAIT